MQHTVKLPLMMTRKPGAPVGNDFDEVALRLASPERIKEWSQGEVTKPETINYRTQRSEKSGLFDEKIFGPDKDYECYCGKYRGIRYRGIVCEKCGVEITRAIVRRERMGHIELATPVAHVWFLRSLPSRIATTLGIPAPDVEKVVYFAGYIVTKVSSEEKARVLRELDAEFRSKVKALSDERSKEALKERLVAARKEVEGLVEAAVLDEVAYHNHSLRYGTVFEAGIGAEVIYRMLRDLELKKLVPALEAAREDATAVERERIGKRLGVLRAMLAAGTRPEWMFLTRIPVIPPALRPMVPLDGGRYATSDVNDLYRRVINRNNRLRKLMDIKAPEVILRNEKRILQEAVDALIDNSIRHGSASQNPASQAGRRSLKSLADNLKGKRGLFRQNLLGKRVDYSGRSVIVVGPELELHQCGLPKHMALELFRPFVISELLKRELAYNIRGAGRLIEEEVPEVWAILEEVIRDKYVLLNRAPTLHRLGIQAFKPTLIEGSAIQVHPLVCTAFNADFDGDQMAVHVPLSLEAQIEAREIMASDKNILKPGSGNVIASIDKLDIVLGCFSATKEGESGETGEGKVFESVESAVAAWDFGVVSLRAKIRVLVPDTPKYKEFAGTLLETTVGRLLFNGVLPDDHPFINREIDRKKMGGIVDELIARYGLREVPRILDRVKRFGFRFATSSGITWGIDDVVVPAEKAAIVERAKRESETVYSQWHEGLLSTEERMRKNVEIWHGAKNDVEKAVLAALDRGGSVYDMVMSGARGSLAQITQMAGMKGLIQNTRGETIEFPILSCSKEGLTPIEYFITTHGSRKGLTDTALNTAKAGYLTRKLFVVAQDVLITEEDCGTKEHIVIGKGGASGIEVSLAKNIRGRSLAEDAVAPDGTKLLPRGELISREAAQRIQDAGVSAISVRSPLVCKTAEGICARCYGFDLGKGELVAVGEAVGTVAAQAIGEPGTQLTMRTFHAGGTASVGGDITQGLPRVEEVFEKRKPRNPAIVAESGGVVTEIRENGREKIITVLTEPSERKKGSKKGASVEYTVPFGRMPLVKTGSRIEKGDIITDGSADIDEVFRYAGKERAQHYIISEVIRPYELQGESVSRKHIEVIVRQMFSRRRIRHPGGTTFFTGDVADETELARENEKARENGGDAANAEPVVLGITEVSLTRKSFLSAASFQHTTRVLIGAAIRGATDRLKGLMENVIIGRLIPAGTGFVGGPKHALITEGRRAPGTPKQTP